MKKQVLTPFLFLITILLNLPLFAGGIQSGGNCANAVEIYVEDSIDFTFANQEQALYFEFDATNDSLLLQFEDNGISPFALIYQVELYANDSCANLTLAYSKTIPDTTDKDYFVILGLTENQNYLLKLERNPADGLPAANFKLKLKKYKTIACPNYNLTCGELLTNGGFDYFTVVPGIPGWNFKNPFGFNVVAESQVCDWESGSLTPQIKGASNYNALQVSFYKYATVQTESLLKSISLSTSSTYVFSFKLRKSGTNPLPDSYKVKILNEDAISSPIIESLPSHLIADIPKSQIDATGNWATYIYCFTPNFNTDRMLFYPESSPTSTPVNTSIHLDDISIKELKELDVGPTIDACDNIRLIGVEDNCALQGAIYSWSPTTGLTSPNSPQTYVDFTDINIFYTLTMTIPGAITCTSDVATVLVSGHYKNNAIPDGEDVAWIRTNVPYTGTNPVVVSNRTFFVEGEFIVDEDITFVDCDFHFAGDAKITVDNATLEFDNVDNQLNFLTTCNPDIFWDGIYVDANNGGRLNFKGENTQGDERTIELSNSTNGLVLKNTPGGKITNVIFDRNKRAINFEGVGPTLHITEIIGCEFKSSSPIISEEGSPYYPAYSIEALNFNPGASSPDLLEIRFNFPSTLFNEFYGTGGGIFLNNSGARISTPKFIDFQNLLFNPDLPLTSVNPIKIFGTSNNVNNPIIRISATFTNCKQAIFSDGSAELYIDGCVFNANGSLRPTANFATVLNNYDYTSFIDNTINDAGLGIAVFNSSNVIIYDNTMNLQTQSGSNYTDKSNDRSVGITVMNLNLNDPSNPIPQNVKIELNTIKHAKIGISADFTQATINNNTILDLNDRFVQATSCYPLPSPCTSLPAYGIRTLGANYGYVIEENTVKLDLTNYTTSNPQNNPKVTAISIENSINPLSIATEVICNQVEGTGIGLKFSGTNSVATVVEKNTMKNHYFGFVLANNGFIGDVGSNGIAADNEWDVTPGSFGASKTFSEFSYGSNCILYVQNIPKFNPSIATGDATFGFTPIQSDDAGNSASQATCETPSLRLKGGADSLFVRRPSVKDTTGFVRKLAKGKMNYMLHAADSAARLNQQLLYWQITHDSVLNTDTSWQSFKDSMNNTALGKSLGNNSRAVSTPSTNNFDVNVNTLAAIMSKLDSALIINSKDTSDVARVASLCPYYDGIAVYQARYILMQMGYPPVVNACEITSKPVRSSKRIKSLNDEEITVYPNPTQGNLTVSINIKEGQIVLFELYDVLGKKQQTETLREGRLHQLHLNQKQHGIYFYRLLNNSTVIKSGKLIIQ